MNSFFDLLVTQLKDLYSAENQLLVALPHLLDNAECTALASALLEHMAETEDHLDRLDSISSLLGVRLAGHECKAMRGLIREGAERLEQSYATPQLRDVMIVALVQRIEHYEIAAYGNAIALADYLDLQEVSALLRETIDEEATSDRTLTALCQSQLFKDGEPRYPSRETISEIRHFERR